MKKMLKIIGIAFIAICVIIAAGILILACRPAVPEDYTEKVKTGGVIEAKYLADGSHEVKSYKTGSLSSFKSYEIWYPADMTDQTPVVVFCNGTGIKTSKYAAVLKHLASWGFIAIGTEEEHSWYGFSAEMCVRLMTKLARQEKLDDGSSNPFYNCVDLENIGISGHSQGGVSVINAITTTPHADIYKCAFVASPTNKELAQALMWDYDAKRISIPIFLVASTGQADENLVVSGEQLNAIYCDISQVPYKVMARRKDADHGDMLYFADGYMTAFMMWQLQGDTDAAAAFIGDQAEILNNPLYQDQKISLDNASAH